MIDELKTTNQESCNEVLDVVSLTRPEWFANQPARKVPLKVYGSYARRLDIGALKYPYGDKTVVSEEQFQELVRGYLKNASQ